MSNLPLRDLKWRTLEERAYAKTIFRSYHVTRDTESKDKFCVYYGSRTGKPASGFATIEDAKHWAEHEHYQGEMQPYVKPDTITDIANWFKAAKPEPTDKDVGVQTGCLLEEVVELLEGLGFAKQGAVLALHNLAGLFKANSFGGMISELSQEDRIEIVDACCDINVTGTGVMQLLGGVDVLGSQREVIRSNNSKMVKGRFEYDENGKVMKPESYSKPDLTPFVKQGE